MGGTISSLLGGGFIQDRFALFAKAAVLLAVAAAIAVADWSVEDSTTVGLSMTLFAAFGVMVVASAGDFVGLWAGLELAGAAGGALPGMGRAARAPPRLTARGVAPACSLVGHAARGDAHCTLGDERGPGGAP